MHDDGSWIIDPITQVELWVPEGISTERVMTRAERVRAGEVFTVRLQPERGVRWPVWRVGHGLAEEGSLELSAGLNSALTEWALVWETHVTLWGEWSSEADRDQWLRRKRELEDLLERELWDVALVIRDA